MLWLVDGGIPICTEREYLERIEQCDFSARTPPIPNCANGHIPPDYITSWSIFVQANILSKDSRSHLLQIAFPASHDIIEEGLAAKQPTPTFPIYLHLEGVSSLLSLHQGHRKTWNHQLNLLLCKFQRYLKQQVYSWISRLKESEVKHLFKCKQCSINRRHHPNKSLPAKEKGSVCFPRLNCSKTAGWEILHCRKCACRLCTAFVMSKRLDLLKWKTVIYLVAGSSSLL